MKYRGVFALPLLLLTALSLTTGTAETSRAAEAAPDPRASAAKRAALTEKAAFGLDEAAGSRRVLGGEAEEFAAAVAGGAQFGAVGKKGSALGLDGSSGYAATAGPVVDTTKSFSVSAWVKLDDKDANYTFLSQAGARASGFQLYYSKHYDKWVFNRHAADSDSPVIVRAKSKAAARPGVWTHLTGSYDADEESVSLHVNGRLQESAEFTTPWRASGALQLGRLRWHGAWQEYAAAGLDEVRAVQSVVTEADSASMADGELPTHLQELASFSLDESAGETHARGGPGAGMAASVAGRGARLGVVGRTGTALGLDGSSGYAATAGPVVDTTKSFSVSAWVKLDDKDGNYTFVSQAGDRASGFQLYYSEYYDKWVFNRHAKDTDDTKIVRSLSSAAAETGVWTHLAGEYNASAKTVQLFVNGTAQPAAEFTTPWRANSALQIGRLLYKGSFRENAAGTIDDLRISEQTSAVYCADTYAIGHRGAPETAPENTVASLEAAADGGADWVETDVRFSKDGQAVVLHDATVDRTTNGTGRVDEMTAEEISRLTVDGGGRVPTLEQALTALKDKPARLLLEIKGPQTSEAVDRALELVSDAGMTERTLLQSFDEDIVRDAAASPHKTRVALLRSQLDADPVATARAFSLSGYAVKFSGLAARSAAVKQLKSAGVQVFVWTIDSESEWKDATAWGVDGVITNRSDAFLRWREANCAEK